MSNVRKSAPLIRARKILQELCIEAPEEIDLDLICAHYDVHVRYEPIRGTDGALIRRGDRAVITVRSNIREEGKKRFVIAHELGHFFLHPHTRQLDLCSGKDLSKWKYKNGEEEVEANYFAAELLMPGSLFIPRMGKEEPSFELIDRLAGEFNTTRSATAIQFVKSSKDACVFIISKNLKRSWFFAREGFEFFLNEEIKIHGWSCAAEVVKTGKPRVRAKDVPAGVWFRGYSDRGKEVITEESIALGDSGIIFTLLWVEECI